MVVAALVSVLVTGSVGSISFEKQATDFMGSPRAARLLAADEGLGSSARQDGQQGVLLAQADPGAQARLNDINSRINLLELSRPALGWSIAGIVVGSLLVIPGIIVTILGIVGVVAGGVLGLAVLIPGVVLLAGGIVLIALGAGGISNNAARNAEIDSQIESLKQERRQLEIQLGRPISSLTGPAPALTLAAF